jgi:hypothetical protein
MKSKLRSRWYRPNEKPLESSSGNQKNNEPFGEIDTSGLKIEDDLSKISIQIKQNSQNDSKRNNSQSENPKRTSQKIGIGVKVDIAKEQVTDIAKMTIKASFPQKLKTTPKIKIISLARKESTKVMIPIKRTTLIKMVEKS